MKDYDGDEDDGFDETIYPVDHSVYGQIVDDVITLLSPPTCTYVLIFEYR